MKKKVISIGAGIIGLILVFFIGSTISRFLYPEDTSTSQPVQTEGTQEAKPAMTEEEIYAMLETMRLPTGNAAGTVEAAGDATEQEIPIKFDELWEINEDVYAWISIPGAGVEYPILQHKKDNGYYLNHNIDGSYGYPACIYTENLNSKDFTDNNTVIYGHNMKNGTMFGALHQFESKDFFEENTEVMIYLPDQVLHYTIFAAYVYDDRHIMHSFDFTDLDIYAEYLQAIYDIRDMNANINRDFTVTSEDKIITLSTCTNSNPDKRFIVQAVLQQDQ